MDIFTVDVIRTEKQFSSNRGWRVPLRTSPSVPKVVPMSLCQVVSNKKFSSHMGQLELNKAAFSLCQTSSLIRYVVTVSVFQRRLHERLRGQNDFV